MTDTQTEELCPICGKTLKHKARSTNYFATFYNCPYCKRFQLEDDFENYYLKDMSQIDLALLRNILYILPENSNHRQTPIYEENLQELLSQANSPKTLLDKIDNTLAYFVDKTQHFGQRLNINGETLYRELFCVDKQELSSIFETLKGYISFNGLPHSGNTFQVWVEMDGLRYYEENLRQKQRNNQGFVAMWFNDEADLENHKPDMSNVYAKAIKPAIENENLFNSIKIDCVEYCNDINDEMIAQIRKSKFMVADLTGYRGGVYYEAGFAEGLGLPVIYTCHKKWLEGVSDKNIEKVHFDINHKNIIIWEEDKLEDFKTRLINRINAVIV